MRTRVAPLILAAAVLLAACGSGAANPAPRSFSLAGEPMVRCTVAALDYWCGVLKVPENRSLAGGRTIDLQVDVFPARSGSGGGTPVFFLAGGPGDATTRSWAGAPTTFAELSRHHDIVLVDQRGTGSSHRLVLPDPLPGETPAEYARRAMSGVDGDPRYYTTAVAMDDLDSVRKALGYGRIDLYGGSYGATAAQYYMRQHGEHVEAAVLDGGTLLDVPILELVAANSQHALDGVLNRCAAAAACRTAFPDPRGEMSTVLARLTRSPVTTSFQDPSTGQPAVMTAEFFASAIHNQLLAASTAATVPWLIHRAYEGNYGDLASPNASPLEATLLMAVVIRCSEAWARYDPEQVRLTGAGSYYLSAQLAAAQGVAAGCPLAPKGFVPAGDALPLRTSLPVLLLNGTEDPQDPPSNVAGAPLEMPHSYSLAVPAQGHTVGHIGCLPSVVAAFFDAKRVDTARALSCASNLGTAQFKLG